MKKITLLLMIVSLFFVGCIYEAPVSTDSKIPIKKGWLGTWQFGPEFENAKVYISAAGDTEYLLTFPVEDNEFLTKAYHVKIGDIDAIQLKFTGTEDAPLDHNQFNIVLVEEDGKKLRVRFINEFVISTSNQTSSELKNAILENIDNDALFHKPSLELTKID